MDYKKAGVDIEAGYKSVELDERACKENNERGSSWRDSVVFQEHFH